MESSSGTADAVRGGTPDRGDASAGGGPGRATTMIDADVAVIGGGVVGCAVARELAGYQLSVALLEARGDVGDGTIA